MADDDEVPATMKDIKDIEKTVISTMQNRLDEMRDMFASLINAQIAAP